MMGELRSQVRDMGGVPRAEPTRCVMVLAESPMRLCTIVPHCTVFGDAGTVVKVGF